MSNDFTLVTRRKKNKSNKNSCFSIKRDVSIIDDEFDFDILEKRIGLCKDELQNSDYFQDLSSKLFNLINSHSFGNVKELVCYGIGNFSENIAARYQMSMLSLLQSTLEIDSEHTFIYDPIFSKNECSFISSKLNCTLLNVNEEGKRVLGDSTLFFMPHCGKALYNNLLWSNWSYPKLRNLIIFGNSFDEILSNTPDRLLKENASYIVKIKPYYHEVSIPSKFVYEDIFNSLSFLSFCDNMSGNDSIFCDDVPEPVYTDIDILVLNNTL